MQMPSYKVFTTWARYCFVLDKQKYLVLNVAPTHVKRADGAATQPLQTYVGQSFTVTYVEMVQLAQPDKTQKEKRAAM